MRQESAVLRPTPASVGWKPKSTAAQVASVRIRCLNPLRELQARGYPVELFDSRRGADYSAVVYSKLYDDHSYEEAISLKARGVRIIFDLCDNHFYNPHGLAWLQRAGDQARRMMAIADHLVASTEAMADVMRGELPDGGPVTVIGDAVETDLRGVPLFPLRRWVDRHRWRRMQASLDAAIPPPARLVWFGVHGGPAAEHGMLDLLKLGSLLTDLAGRFPLCLTVISNSRRKYDRTVGRWPIPTRYLEWSPETFLPALRAHQVALLPMSTNAFTRCKSNNRLALALHLGLAVAADEIPSYREFGSVCFLDQWESGLRTYLEDPVARERDARAGHAIVARHWTLPVVADRWQAFFDHVRSGRTHGSSPSQPKNRLALESLEG